MEGNFKHQNAYSGYDEVYSIIENFKERVQYIADFPCYDDDSDIKYEDAIEEVWEMIEFMLTDETFNEWFTEDIYDFISKTLEEEGLSLRHDFHRIIDDRNKRELFSPSQVASSRQIVLSRT